MGVSQGFVGGTYYERLVSEDVLVFVWLVYSQESDDLANLRKVVLE